MKTYRVVIPVLKRAEEIYHNVAAESAEQAIEAVRFSDPYDLVEDHEYYEPLTGQARATEVLPDCQIVASRAKLKELDEVLSGLGMDYNDFLTVL